MSVSRAPHACKGQADHGHTLGHASPSQGPTEQADVNVNGDLAVSLFPGEDRTHPPYRPLCVPEGQGGQWEGPALHMPNLGQDQSGWPGASRVPLLDVCCKGQGPMQALELEECQTQAPALPACTTSHAQACPLKKGTAVAYLTACWRHHMRSSTVY